MSLRTREIGILNQQPGPAAVVRPAGRARANRVCTESPQMSQFLRDVTKRNPHDLSMDLGGLQRIDKLQR